MGGAHKHRRSWAIRYRYMTNSCSRDQEAAAQIEFEFRMTFKEKVASKLKQFGVFVFNKNTHQIFGRTCKSWGECIKNKM